MSKLMINNGTDYDMSDIMEYLSGYTTKLFGKVNVYKEDGIYYNTIVVTNKNPK